MKNIFFNVDEAIISIRPGSALLINCTLNFIEDIISNADDPAIINLPLNNAKLINPSFESLSIQTVSTTLKRIHYFSERKIHTHNLVGRLLVLLFHEVQQHATILVGLPGLASDSIELCIDLIKKFLYSHQSKSIILLSLTEQEDELTITTI